MSDVGRPRVVAWALVVAGVLTLVVACLIPIRSVTYDLALTEGIFVVEPDEALSLVTTIEAEVDSARDPIIARHGVRCEIAKDPIADGLKISCRFSIAGEGHAGDFAVVKLTCGHSLCDIFITRTSQEKTGFIPLIAWRPDPDPRIDAAVQDLLGRLHTGIGAQHRLKP